MQFLIRLINDHYVEYLDPREQYRLAATETETWWVFVLRKERQQEVDERYWEIVEEGWFSPFLFDLVCKGHFRHPCDNDQAVVFCASLAVEGE